MTRAASVALCNDGSAAASKECGGGDGPGGDVDSGGAGAGGGACGCGEKTDDGRGSNGGIELLIVSRPVLSTDGRECGGACGRGHCVSVDEEVDGAAKLAVLLFAPSVGVTATLEGQLCAEEERGLDKHESEATAAATAAAVASSLPLAAAAVHAASPPPPPAPPPTPPSSELNPERDLVLYRDGDCWSSWTFA